MVICGWNKCFQTYFSPSHSTASKTHFSYPEFGETGPQVSLCTERNRADKLLHKVSDQEVQMPKSIHIMATDFFWTLLDPGLLGYSPVSTQCMEIFVT